jgi:hypothetical protein
MGAWANAGHPPDIFVRTIFGVPNYTGGMFYAAGTAAETPSVSGE